MLKTILITFTTTAGALALAAYLFLNSILGAFGLTAIPVVALSQLHATQRVVETMKRRHNKKKARVSKRLIKRSGKRVASAASTLTVSSNTPGEKLGSTRLSGTRGKWVCI